jgi:hypothetical protein
MLWAFVFSVISIYWGLGGTFGMETVGEGMLELALSGDAQLMLINWVSVVGKIGLGLLVLALLRNWGGDGLRRLLRIGLWIGGILMLLYGGLNLIQHVLMVTGNVPIASLLGTPEAVRWHIFLWDPWWMLGGILFLLTARYFSQTRG